MYFKRSRCLKHASALTNDFIIVPNTLVHCLQRLFIPIDTYTDRELQRWWFSVSVWGCVYVCSMCGACCVCQLLWQHSRQTFRLRLYSNEMMCLPKATG